MKIFFIFLIYICFTSNLLCQKYDYNYLEEGTRSGIQLRYDSVAEDLDFIPFSWHGILGPTATISNEGGELVCFSSTSHMYNSDFERLPGGDSIAVGIFQNLILNSYPEDQAIGANSAAEYIPIDDSTFYYFHTSLEGWRGAPDWPLEFEEHGQTIPAYASGIYLSIVRLDEVGEPFILPEEKEQVILLDTLCSGQLSIFKHANGEDWWIHNPRVMNDEAHLLLMTKEGEIIEQKKYVYSDQNSRVRSRQAAVVNANGTMMGRLTYTADTNFYSKIELFNLDRCTGETERLYIDSIPLPDIFSSDADIEFSHDGRFVYIAHGNFLFQLDTEEEDIVDMMDTVGVWDGFRYANVVPTFFSNLWRMPNGKIACVGFGVDPYIHYIHEPNEKGSACNFEQRARELPLDPENPGFSVGISFLPTFPNYRMEALDVVCETSTNEQVEKGVILSLYPNPATDIIQIDGLKDVTLFQIYNMSGVLVQKGKTAFSVDVSSLPAGMYSLHIKDSTQPLKFINL